MNVQVKIVTLIYHGLLLQSFSPLHCVWCVCVCLPVNKAALIAVCIYRVQCAVEDKTGKLKIEQPEMMALPYFTVSGKKHPKKC